MKLVEYSTHEVFCLNAWINVVIDRQYGVKPVISMLKKKWNKQSKNNGQLQQKSCAERVK